MPKVDMQKLYPTKTVSLISIEGWEVVMTTKMKVGDTRKLLEMYPNMSGDNASTSDAQKASIQMLILCIVSWNLEDDNWVWPIDAEHIEMLTSEDFTILIQQLTPDQSEKKKPD